MGCLIWEQCSGSWHSQYCSCHRYRMLNISPDGMSDMGAVQWELALCLLGAWIITFFCMIKGIKSTGRVCYVILYINTTFRSTRTRVFFAIFVFIFHIWGSAHRGVILHILCLILPFFSLHSFHLNIFSYITVLVLVFLSFNVHPLPCSDHYILLGSPYRRKTNRRDYSCNRGGTHIVEITLAITEEQGPVKKIIAVTEELTTQTAVLTTAIPKQNISL